MNLRKLKLASLFATILLPTLLSLLVLVKPYNVFAQAANVSLLCESSDKKSISWPETSDKCKSGTISIIPQSLPTNFTALCLAGRQDKPDEIFNAVTTSGQISCEKYTKDPYYVADLFNRDQIQGTPPVTVTPPIKNPPVTPGTTKPKVPPGSTTGSTSKVNDIGGCPDGFTSKGPLCIPNNPFGNSEGIVGKGTLGELASTVISILLGMAGIVAVIFVIIGGYQFMTARGNETQSTEGRKTVVNALIGLAIIIVSYAVVQAVTNYLTTGK